MDVSEAQQGMSAWNRVTEVLHRAWCVVSSRASNTGRLADAGGGSSTDVELARKPARSVLDEYVDTLPTPQNAVDVVAGWNHALPPVAQASAGTAAFYEDPRILWCIERFGDLAGRRVLELGPLEASHTFMLNQHAPQVIHAIEANKLSFVRCLVAKELLGLDRARFMLGDFQKWLEAREERYDLIVASGVLYHMRDPARLIDLISRRTDATYLWTHYFCDTAMPAGDYRRGAFSGSVETREVSGLTVRLHERSYHEAWRDKSFCGGMHDSHYWMEKPHIIRLLEIHGFNRIEIAHELLDHPNGPCMSIFARRE